MLGLTSGYIKERLSFWDSNLVLKQGEVLALFGPNGAGRADASGTIAGLIPQLEGTVETRASG